MNYENIFNHVYSSLEEHSYFDVNEYITEGANMQTFKIWCSKSKKEVVRLTKEGNEAFRNKNYSSAKQSYDKAIKIYEDMKRGILNTKDTLLSDMHGNGLVGMMMGPAAASSYNSASNYKTNNGFKKEFLRVLDMKINELKNKISKCK